MLSLRHYLVYHCLDCKLIFYVRAVLNINYKSAYASDPLMNNIFSFITYLVKIKKFLYDQYDRR